MSRKNYFILIFTILLSLSGCDDDKSHNTSHPEEESITLTIDWPDIAGTSPPAYLARVTSSLGTTRVFENLNGTTNSLVVEPGESTLFVYNHAENITISGTKAIVNKTGTGIASDPGLFFSYSGKIAAERDRDMTHTALMKQQTGDLKISLAIKPAAMISRIRNIHAVLEGVASELEMHTNTLSAPSAVAFTLPPGNYYAAATVRLLGFDASTEQNLTLNIEFENGHTINATNDLTSLLKDFNASNNNLFSLHADMYIAGENATTATLDHWECNTESRYLSVSDPEVSLPGHASDKSVTVTTDQPSWEYSVVQTGNWLTITKTGGQLEISAAENTETPREATIHVSAGGLNESITVTQDVFTAGFYADKEIVKIHNATIGNGINIVVLGDGYTSEAMTKGSGKYEQDMRKATESFFSVYPYTLYKDYFNVYMIAAISNEEGISIETANTTVDTKFGSTWEGGFSTGINCDPYTVAEYVYEIPQLSSVDIHDITVIMPINAYIYAGTCSMHFPESGSGYGEGFSISMCPVGRDFDRVVVHEAAGHGFSKVFDEYIYLPEETIPEAEKNEINLYKTWGWCENIDFYGNMLQTSWRDFANNPRYSMVGTFEGANTYGKGIWRPENNSCMNNSIPYFNAPTRWAQVRRIMRLAGFNYSFSQFLQDDIIPEYPPDTRSGIKNPRPLAPPVMSKLDPNRIRRIKHTD